MPILSEITGITIKDRHFVVELRGKDLDTENEILLRVDEEPIGTYYLKDLNSGQNLIIQIIKQGSKETPCFYVEDPKDPTKNLLIEMEKQLTGGP